jgi:transposase
LDSGNRADAPSGMADRLKALEWENREWRQANKILCEANVYFAQREFDYSFKR